MRVTINNWLAAGYIVLAGNMHGGYALQIVGVFRCDNCGSFVPQDMIGEGDCVSCRTAIHPTASTGGNGDVHAAA